MSDYLSGVNPEGSHSQEIYEKFDFANPENPGFAKIEHFKPVFAFDYISLGKTKLCFNNPDLEARNFHDFLGRLYDISTKSYSDVHDNDKHFHKINLARKKHEDVQAILIEDAKFFAEKEDIDAENLPEIWQFTIATDNENNYAPRVVGFFGTHGIFYLLWFDLEHSIYEKK